MKVTNSSKNTILADKAKVAEGFFARLIGLLNRKSLNQGEALVLSPSNSIHSFFMRFTIDAIFLDKAAKVIAALPSFKPFRLSGVYFNSHTVIELPADTIRITRTEPGDTIQIL